MQTLVELLVELKALVATDSRDKLDRINKLFDNPKNPAEFEVGRYFVAKMLAPDVEERITSLDPKQRKLAITTARLVFPRTRVARALRQLFNDPDLDVRATSRAAVRGLGLAPNAPAGVRERTSDGTGGYDAVAWAFGMFANEWKAQR
ncbi:MAG TPA: hypothetical protein VGO00_14820, partial [Kofleriaceae bacterium]|nr:hypothetical protein [Kofleriaceae bacterium]